LTWDDQVDRAVLVALTCGACDRLLWGQMQMGETSDELTHDRPSGQTVVVSSIDSGGTIANTLSIDSSCATFGPVVVH
jgi:hypothetical protein